MPSHDEIKALIRTAFLHQQLAFTYAYGEKINLLEMQKHLLPFYPEYFDKSMNIVQCSNCKALWKHGKFSNECPNCETEYKVTLTIVK